MAKELLPVHLGLASSPSIAPGIKLPPPVTKHSAIPSSLLDVI